jgi:hypothetical protein
MVRKLTILSWIAAACLGLLLLGALVWANREYVQAHPLERDFLVPWLGARTFLQYGVSPYSDQASQRAQLLIYGRLAFAGEDPLQLDLSLPLELLYFPFALITDYNLAGALWMTLGEISLACTALLSVFLTGWRSRRFFLPVVVLLLMFSAFSLAALLAGSPAPLAALGIAGLLAGLKRGREEAAGAFLVLVLLLPASALPMLLFLLFTDASRRKRLWGGFLALIGPLTLLAFLLLPGWLFPSLKNLLTELVHNPALTAGGLFTLWWPAIGKQIGWIFTAVLVLLLIIEWASLRGKDFRHLLWTACLTLAAAPLTGLPISMDAFVLLLPPLVLVLAVAAERWSGEWTVLISLLVLLGICAASWLLLDSLPAALLVPSFLLLVGLYWMRWWAVRPPKTMIESMQP